MTDLPLSFSPEVAKARATGAAIVALESTIITHGMPFPQNLETARAVEAEVRAAGAVPATIAVMEGRIRIGLSPDDLARLAQARDAAKLSRADLAACLVRGTTGATTVAATMIAAHLAGIAVFATGGIGGVHRGAETSFDISADLHELARTPVTVVAAGAKAILDLGKTLEVLETPRRAGHRLWPGRFSRLLVALLGPARTPAHRQRRRDCRGAPHARAARAGRRPAGGEPDPGGGRDPPRHHHPGDRDRPGRGRSTGHRRQGGDPFLLARIFDLTQGRSLSANIALVLNNARLGAAIAREIAAAG